MLLRKLKNISFFSRFSLLGLLFLINACTDIKKAMVHDYPKEKAFVFDNKIVIKDALSKSSLQELSYNLDTYWDDSLKAKRIRQFGIFNNLIQPISFQPERIDRSIHYMQSYLASKGYHHPNLNLIVKTDTVHNEYRVHLSMIVQLNKKTIVDTATYQLGNPNLQAIALANRDLAYVKKGMAFSNESVNNELDRLVALFRSNGYYYFTKEKIFAEVDTMNQSLMTLNLDPLAQVNQVKDASKKEQENPSWKISFQLRNTDSTNTKSYAIGRQIFYSDLSLADNPDTIINKGLLQKEEYNDITHQYNKLKFKTKLFEEQSMIHSGSLYNEHLFYQTLNNLSGLGAWQQIDARTTLQNDSVYLHYFLVPALRRNFSADLEGSRNTAQIGAGNLLGLSTSITYRDRNVQKKSIQSISNIRAGVELDLNNTNLTQTLLMNVGQTYSFPKLLVPFKIISKNYSANSKTNFTLNGSYIDRLDYYQLKSFTTNWGYEWKRNKLGKEDMLSYKPVNVELYSLNKFAKLDSLLLLNPFLRSSFNSGNVISQTISYVHAGPSLNRPNQSNYLRIGIEEAGGLLGLNKDLQKNIYQYIKTEIELRKLIKYDYSEIAWRFMGGWGNNYSKNTALGGQLPFFKQFTAGGPYSMRAWGLRQLGLGSSQFYDTSSKRQNFDRFGDLQLETNFEYRFNIVQFGSYKIASALFTDIGNIWNTRDTKQDPNAGFKLDRLYKDLAIGVGTGLRLDFNYFLIRIDYAMKMKDPTRDYNNGWLDLRNMKWAETKPNGTRVNNYAWQFGIGLPF
jgi:outer membrane protein insertion porin family